MVLNKMAEQTIVEFKHAKKYFKSLLLKTRKKTKGEKENKWRKRKQIEKKKTKRGKENRQRKRKQKEKKRTNGEKENK